MPGPESVLLKLGTLQSDRQVPASNSACWRDDMKTLKMMGRILALVLMASTFAVRAEAATISIVPGTQNALIGDLVSVDIVVSGLLANESVGGVSLLLSFTNILSGAGFSIDPDD